VRKAVAVTLMGVVVASPLDAQTVDVFYRSWRWLKEPSAARSAGLAGSATALADDAGSAEANPASLTSLSKSEVRATLLSRGSGQTAAGDALGARTGIGFLGFAGRLSPRWAVGAYVVEPQSARLESGSTPPAGATETGTLDGTLREVGVSLAWRAHRTLHLGVRLSANSLSLDGSYRVAGPQGGPIVEVETRGESTRTAVSWGVLYQAGPRVRLGLAHLGGARWPTPRTTRVGSVLGQASTPGDYEVRQPTVTSGGVSYEVSPRVLVTSQLDHVRYGEIQTPFASLPDATAATRYALYAWEPRVGLEVSLPFRSLSLQLRGGLRGRNAAAAQELRPGAFAAVDARPQFRTTSPTPAPSPQASPAPTGSMPPAAPNPDAALRQATVALLAETPPPVNEPKVRGSLGASLVLANGVSLDLAALVGGEPTAVLAGVALRF
jgi:hypothetical protein